MFIYARIGIGQFVRFVDIVVVVVKLYTCFSLFSFCELFCYHLLAKLFSFSEIQNLRFFYCITTILDGQCLHFAYYYIIFICLTLNSICSKNKSMVSIHVGHSTITRTILMYFLLLFLLVDCATQIVDVFLYFNKNKYDLRAFDVYI